MMIGRQRQNAKQWHVVMNSVSDSCSCCLAGFSNELCLIRHLYMDKCDGQRNVMQAMPETGQASGDSEEQ